MSIQSLRASLALLDTTPNARLSYDAPPRSIYHQIAQDVMLIQGIHYAVEEALTNVGELVSSDPLLDPRRRCLLRLQRDLTDIARISENVQERMLQNIISHASTAQALSVAEEASVSQRVTGSIPLPTTSIATPPPCIKDSDGAVVSHWESLDQSDSKPLAPPPSPEDLYQVVLERRSKRKAPYEDDDCVPRPPANRPGRDPNGSIHLRPIPRQREERTSAFGWARWMFSKPKQ